MANTTNFNWETPDDTDLVKDGAAAMRTLGNSIDSSFVDLKGGTTGQVLAKASGTDLDYTWTTPETVPTSLGFTAGKNKIINGDFNIWQRGTSFTLAGSGVNNYTADRFNAQFNGTGATCTVSQQAFTAGTAPVAGYEGQFFARWNRSAAGSGNTLNYYKQPIEDVRTFAGQPVTLSFWAKADSARSLSAQIYQEFGSGGSGAVLALNGTVSVTTSWQRFTISATVPSIAGKTVGTGSSLTLYFIMPTGVAFTFDYWGVQLEAGSAATSFQTATGTIQGELAACQRYYQAPSLTPQNLMIYGGSSSGGFSANAYSNRLFPVEMRTTPTVTFYAHDASAGQVTLYVSSTAIKSTSVASIGLQPWRNYNVRLYL